ncbi:glycosyltransferase [candidate division WWE3 bacterium]|uniref:Glycosyltransferase n=1 Tax=candidate division WWE3 bacterium TaxID=2053526 RepID=A0A7X9DL39_UNCKA|nr:glycosyltransferase [candidate division WWE3 bacterium]
MLVSVIVPAYKQQKTIKDDIRRIYNVMTKTRWDFEIIVVVDGFQDKTYENACELKLSEVTVVGYPTNRGKGYAVRYGMARAVGDYIAFIDSGMDIDPNGISMILEHMEWYEADIIVGSKGHPASKVVYPWWRKMYSKGYYALVRILFGIKVRDTQTGLKVYKREVLEKVLPRLVVKKFAFDIELLSVAKRLGFKRIYEAPVVITMDYKRSSFTRLLFLDPEIQRILYDTISIFYRMHFLKYYDDNSRRKWVYDKELDLYVNTGEVENK